MVVLLKRQADPQQNSSTFPSSAWLPIVVIGGVLLLVAIGLWSRKKMRQDVQVTATSATASTANTSGTPGQPAARRPRRNRRRASQISTKSLPAYMEEADESEVVLVRRAAEAMPTLSEQETRPSMSSEETMSDEHVGTPLLERDPHAMPLSNAGLSPTGQLDSGNSIHFPEPQLRDIRGEAPSYFEAVEAVEVATPQPSPSVPPASTSPDDPTHHRRQSLFRTLFTRNGDHLAPTSLDNHATPSRHRPSTSVSSLRPSLSLYRTRSSESTTEQSQIPLRNISAPIAHTLVRTEFTFPKNGPSEQQIKFLASRESLGRFGLPFGDEARADPPSFDIVVAATASTASLLTSSHGQNPSFSSSMYLHGSDDPAAGSTSTANVDVVDNLPLPDSPSSDISDSHMPEGELVRPVVADTAPIRPTLIANPSGFVPRRMSTIQSAVEPPETPRPGETIARSSTTSPAPANGATAKRTSIAS